MLYCIFVPTSYQLVVIPESCQLGRSKWYFHTSEREPEYVAMLTLDRYTFDHVHLFRGMLIFLCPSYTCPFSFPFTFSVLNVSCKFSSVVVCCDNENCCVCRSIFSTLIFQGRLLSRNQRLLLLGRILLL